MKQYCRYCSHACAYEDDLFYCEKKNYCFDKIKGSRTNQCEDFEFNEIDVFDLNHTYKPRKKEKSNQRYLIKKRKCNYNGKNS